MKWSRFFFSIGCLISAGSSGLFLIFVGIKDIPSVGILGFLIGLSALAGIWALDEKIPNTILPSRNRMIFTISSMFGCAGSSVLLLVTGVKDIQSVGIVLFTLGGAILFSVWALDEKIPAVDES
jgi:hypothetical protein